MDSKTPTQLAEQAAVKRAIKVLGGPANAAIALKVPHGRYQTVQQWALNRVPAEYCPAIERETSARGEPVRCEEIRSDVPWDVLRMQITPKRRATDKSDRRTSKVEGA